MTDVSQDEADVKLYTTKQVSVLCQVTTETVRAWITNKDIKAINLNGYWRISHADLKEFLDSRHGGTSAEG